MEFKKKFKLKLWQFMGLVSYKYDSECCRVYYSLERFEVLETYEDSSEYCRGITFRHFVFASLVWTREVVVKWWAEHSETWKSMLC